MISAMPKKKKFTVKVNFPVFVTVEATDEDEAEGIAIPEAERIFDVSSIEPEIESVSLTKD